MPPHHTLITFADERYRLTYGKHLYINVGKRQYRQEGQAWMEWHRGQWRRLQDADILFELRLMLSHACKDLDKKSHDQIILHLERLPDAGVSIQTSAAWIDTANHEVRGGQATA